MALLLVSAAQWARTTKPTFADIQANLERDSYAFVRALDMRDLLEKEGAFDKGSREHHNDVDSLVAVWKNVKPQRDENGREVYPYKGTAVSYYDLEQGVVKRNKRHVKKDGWPTEGEVIEYIDPTTADDTVSHFRVHQQWPVPIDANFVLRAMQRLIFRVAGGERIREGISPFEMMMTAYRVTKKAGGHGDGDPGPEGTHQDSANLTVVVLMNRQNVAADSGGNRVWSLDQPFGKPSDADVSSNRVLANLTLLERFDAFFVHDRKVKHEALPLRADQVGQDAVREVWTFELRPPKPVAAAKDEL